MRKFLLMVALVALCSTSARAQAKALTNDPLTGLPVIPTTITKSGTNEPDNIPDARICKSAMKANMYSLIFYMFVDHYDKSKATVSATVAWYTAHLKGFKKLDGYDGQRSQTFFTNADGTTMVVVTGNSAAKGVDGPAYGVTYYRYQPGLSPTTIAGMANGKIVCK
jgi:hypothetical protein